MHYLKKWILIGIDLTQLLRKQNGCTVRVLYLISPVQAEAKACTRMTLTPPSPMHAFARILMTPPPPRPACALLECPLTLIKKLGRERWEPLGFQCLPPQMIVTCKIILLIGSYCLFWPCVGQSGRLYPRALGRIFSRCSG